MEKINENIWSEIHSDYEENNDIFIDAWSTDDDNESGSTIATINKLTKNIVYIDDRAKTNEFAQEVINDVLLSL